MTAQGNAEFGVRNAEFLSNTRPASVLQHAGTALKTDQELLITTGAGVLSLEQIQPAGKRAMSAADFLRGNPVQVGDRFE